MTDNEIIKALECLTGFQKLCKDCPYSGTDHYPFCREHCAKDALALINRQQAEIEMLKGWERLLKAESHAPIIKKARAEAIKEFAERLKNHFDTYTEGEEESCLYFINVINDLVQEMVGD